MSINWYSSEIKYLDWIIFGIAILLIISLIIEFRRKNKASTTFLRVIATTLLMISLLAVLVQPAYKIMVERGSILLVTPGYQENSKDSLATTVEHVYHLDSLSNSKKYEILTEQNVFLIGNGLTNEDAFYYQDESIQYLQDSFNESGIRKVFYNKSLIEGDSLAVSGSFNFTDNSGLYLRLLDETVDSLSMTPGLNTFNLKAQIKTPGVYLAHLISVAGKDTTKLKLPLIVDKRPKYRVLIANSFPTFEMNYLNNYLRQEGHAVAVRNRITSGRYKFEFHNIDRIPLNKLDEGTLKEFDLFISDFETVSRLNDTMMADCVREGLGILVIPDEKFFTLNNLFTTINYKQVAQESETVILNDNPVDIPAYPYRFLSGFNSHLLYNGLGKIKRFGSGFIGVTSALNTYQLILKGKGDDYKAFWNKTLSGLWQSKNSDYVEYSVPVIIDRSVDFQINSDERIVKVKVGESPLPFLQDPHLPNKYEATYWPKNEGWHMFYYNNDSSRFYVSDSKPWKTHLSYERHLANKRYFSKVKDADNTELFAKDEKINRLWFFLVFLTCAAYLWLQPKIQ